MESRVGVLLDDLPAGLRDRAAADALARPASAWQARAMRQLSATKLRLTYRRWLALAEGQFKGQLPLPPVTAADITLDTAGARRETVDGHDVVSIGYTYAGTLVTDSVTVVDSEKALVDLGGSWDEPFIFPIDPDLLFQRTGYACIRETQSIGTHPVDGENALQFFDHSCATTDPVEIKNCHKTVDTWPVDCTQALADSIGRVTTALHFERIAWNDELADAARVIDAPPPVADLAVVTPGLENHRIVYRYFPPDSCAIDEGCVAAPGWRRLLQFDATVHNIGATAIEIGDPTSSVYADHNVYEWSECHEHPHFRFYGDFGLDGQTVVGSKRAFCLVSTTRYSNNETSPLSTDFDTCSEQGIAAGWGDDYYAGLDCQWLDITDVDTSTAPVTTAVTFQSNPDGFLCEGEPVLDAHGDPEFEPTDLVTSTNMPIDRPQCSFMSDFDANNHGSAPVVIPQRGGYVTAPCTHDEIGPLRDCGFTQPDVPTACTAGSSVTVTCTAPNGSAPQLVRLCEWSDVLDTGLACPSAESLGSAVIDGAAATLTTTCPVGRDITEHGGKLAVYTAPAFDGDAAATVSCTVSP